MTQPVTLRTLKPHLRECGYAPRLLRSGFRFGADRQLALAAFAHEPPDARSACIAVAEQNGGGAEAVASYQEMGAPVVFLCRPDGLEWWKQGAERPERVEAVPARHVATFFRKWRDRFAPEAIFRAKTWAHLNKDYQLSFVDLGLMPVVEADIGRTLSNLLERVIIQNKKKLWPDQITVKEGQWLVKSAFWLLAAKILGDKNVGDFPSLDLSDVRGVFRCVGQHYATSVPLRVSSGAPHEALVEAAQTIKEFANLGHVTTESLAYLYENALISKETRAELGTHSTPSYLVDYVVWQLVPWIEDIPEEDRNVFEPACGHAAFLVSAMRLLRELASPDSGRRRTLHRYLQARLHGTDVDDFALEIARLSLTLADVPNPDGWDLSSADMFASDELSKQASEATILLTNPPFQNFSAQDRKTYGARYASKAAELLARTLPHLRPGSVFGVVVPQALLRSKRTTSLREMMLRDCEIAEVCLFPDKTFAFSGAESAIIVGRRVTSRRSRAQPVRFRRVRERNMDAFKKSYSVTNEYRVPQLRFAEDKELKMYVPDLAEVWDACKGFPALEDIADIHKGLDFVNRDTLESMGTKAWSQSAFRGAKLGFRRLSPGLQIHELPRTVWMNLEPGVVKVPRSGTRTGVPQVLLNYARVSRGPWRLKAFMDSEGHAVTSRFITVRPSGTNQPPEYLWAICNSPLANAYVYAHTEKRDILVGMVRKMPVPPVSSAGMERVATAARAYLYAVSQSPDGLGMVAGDDEAPGLLLRVDAQVLRLYDLPPRLERQLLDLFAGEQRLGVPFAMDRYFPEDYEPCFSLHEYLSDGYRRSTAGELRARYKPVTSPGLLAALDRAVRDFGE